MSKRLDPSSAGNGASQEEFTLHDVSAAVSKQLQLPPELHEVSDLAGKLRGFVNNEPAFRKSGLDGASFRSLLMSNLSPEAVRMMDPSHLAKLRTEQSKNANPTSAQHAALQLSRFGESRADASGSGRGERGSSANYDGIVNGNWSSEAGLAQMRDYALQHGVGWAANNSEILKLGPAAIDVLARTGLRKDVYTGLTKDAGLSAKGAIGIADILAKNGQDANTAGEQLTKNLVEINDKDYKSAVDNLGKAQLKPNATETEKAAAVEEVKKAGVEAAKRNPAAAAKIEKTNKMIGVEAEKNTKTHEIDGKQASNNAKTEEKVDAKQNEKDAILAALGASKPSSVTTEVGKTDKPKPQAASAKAPSRAVSLVRRWVVEF